MAVAVAIVHSLAVDVACGGSVRNMSFCWLEGTQSLWPLCSRCRHVAPWVEVAAVYVVLDVLTVVLVVQACPVILLVIAADFFLVTCYFRFLT